MSSSPNRPTIRTIAKKAGCSSATVSYALRESPLIPAATRKKILAIARELGYRPAPKVSEMMAQVRASAGAGRSECLAFLTMAPTRDGWRHPTTVKFASGAKAAAEKLGYGLDEFWLREPGMTRDRLAGILQARGIRGLIVMPYSSAKPSATARHLTFPWKRFALATYSTILMRPDLHRASVYHYQTITECLRQLRTLGYRRIGLAFHRYGDLGVNRVWSAGLSAHQQSVSKSDRIPPLFFEHETMTPASFTKWFKKWRPDVIIGYSLPFFEEHLGNLGLMIPRDVGFATLAWYEELPPCAGMCQNEDLLGSACVDLVVEQLHRDHRGIPDHPKYVMIESSWRNGPTVLRH